MSECVEATPDKIAWVGLGWVQDRTGKGLFVEHGGECEKYVVEQIRASLEDMMSYRNQDLGRIKYRIVGIPCDKETVCALACAVYKVEGW